MRLKSDDFDMNCIEMAKFLLGKVLVRQLEDNTFLRGKIVETESYLGGLDKASHSFNGRYVESKYFLLNLCITLFSEELQETRQCL